MNRNCIIETTSLDTNRFASTDPHSVPIGRRLFTILTVTALVLVGSSGLGCRQQKQKDEEEFDFTVYADLPGLELSHHKELQDELARLKTEGATPAELAVRMKPPEGRVELQKRLEKVIPDPDSTSAMLDYLERYRLLGTETFDHVQLVEAVTVASNYEEERLAMWRAIDDQNAILWVDFRKGNAIDLSFVDQLTVGFRLEAIQLARGVGKNELEIAISAWHRMLVYSNRLAQVWHVVPRIRAAELRAEALVGLQWIVNMEGADVEVQNRLRGRLLSELSNWPAEKQVWMGDRAIGLHTFEMVRDGQFLSLLTDEESEALNNKGARYKTAQAVSVEVDGDEWYYLEFMRKLISISDEPFFKRADELAALRVRSVGLESAGKYPYVSEELLLDGIEQAQRFIAMDRARFELWALVLSQSSGQTLPLFDRNPHTGEPYAMEQQDGYVVGYGLDESRGEFSPRVPMLVN